MVLEDLHWAEEPLLDLLEAGSHDVTGRLVLVGTRDRSSSRADRVGAVAGPSIESLWLEALSTADTDLMLEELLPAVLPDALRRIVVERAEGNPFFTEELVGR